MSLWLYYKYRQCFIFITLNTRRSRVWTYEAISTYTTNNRNIQHKTDPSYTSEMVRFLTMPKIRPVLWTADMKSPESMRHNVLWFLKYVHLSCHWHQGSWLTLNSAPIVNQDVEEPRKHDKYKVCIMFWPMIWPAAYLSRLRVNLVAAISICCRKQLLRDWTFGLLNSI